MQTAAAGIDWGLAGEPGSRDWIGLANAARHALRGDLALMLLSCAAVLLAAGCGSLGGSLLAAGAPQAGEPDAPLGPSPVVGEQAEPDLDGESGSDPNADPETEPGDDEGIEPQTDSEADSGTETDTNPGTDPGGDQATGGGTEPGVEPGAGDTDPDPEPESTPLEQARLTCEQMGLSGGAIDVTVTFAQEAVGSGFTTLQAIEFVRTPCVAACADPLTVCQLACTDCAVVVIGAVSDE